MLEREIEKYLIKRCKEEGILCEKFVSPNNRGVPDRILMYLRRVLFLELKASGRKPSMRQTKDHARRHEDAEIYWTDSKAGVDMVILAVLTNSSLGYSEDFKVLI